MIKWFRKAKLSRQLSLINCLCFLIPTLFLWYTMFSSLQSAAIRTREQEARLWCGQMETQVNRVAEVCNMSTQVFLNTPDLVGHLEALKRGENLDSLELLDFYREDITSLEKIILSNPDIYQIRVYAEADNINEMMPILYSAKRMERMPWAKEELSLGVWYLNYEDQIFSGVPAVPHVMSLVTPVIGAESDRVGVVEVSVRMDEVFPELFEENTRMFSALVSEEGELLAGSLPEELGELKSAEFSGEPEIRRINGLRVLVIRTWLRELNCGYVQITSLSDLDAVMAEQAILLFIALLAASGLMVFAISRLTGQMLRGFYGPLDGIREFANGNIDAKVEVKGEGEAAAYAREAGNLLDKIRQLMHDDVERQIQARNSEIKALHNQINAHFIYNVLEAIKMMAEIEEKYDIADAVTSLGKLLRYSMKWESGNVRLERELEYIENYIALMNLRFDYVISLRLDIPPELLSQRLPKVSLQPIVENAVVHGAAILTADTTISIKGELDKEKGRYAILVTDEGKGMDEETLTHLRRQIAGEEPARSSSGNGIGLNNVDERIRQTFGEGYGLSVDSRQGIGTTVTVTFPYHEEKEGQEVKEDQ